MLPQTSRAVPEPMNSSACAMDPLQNRLRLAMLGYLLIYPLGWLQQHPSPADLAWSLAAVAVFLPVYLRSWTAPTSQRLACAALMLGLGFALYRCGGIWSVFVVYAASTTAFAQPPRIAVAGLASTLVLTALFGIVCHARTGDWATGVFFGAIIGVATLSIAAIKQRDEALAASREESRRLAQLAERERIARDLHDVLGHTLTLVAVKADLARRLLDHDADGARRELEDIQASARSALGDVRAAVSGMRSTTLAGELAEARRALSSSGVEVDATTTAEPFPPVVETALAYIVRESATNIIRHARATRCRIALTREGRHACLEIRDDGNGAPIVAGHGINGMRQRLAAVGGELHIAGGDGTLIRARAPLEAQPT